MCILVVDDEALVRMTTADTLRDAGFTVVEASNTRDALSKFGNGMGFRGLVTDIEMPGTSNGYVLAAHARATKADLAVVVVSGRICPLSCVCRFTADFSQSRSNLPCLYRSCGRLSMR